MDTLTIRQKLLELIDTSDDERIEHIYTIINQDDTTRYEWWNDGEMVAELEQISADMDSGKDKGFTLEESMEQLKLLLKKRD